MRPQGTFLFFLFSRDEATLYERVSVRPSVGPSVRWLVTLSFFGLLGATNAVYTAPLLVFPFFSVFLSPRHSFLLIALSSSLQSLPSRSFLIVAPSS